jgi:sulfoxide reductase heme-binding subunit YedZ
VLLRRVLGVTTACYAGTHLLLYCVDQNWHLGTVISEIVRRFYLTVGFVTLLGLIALAATSTDAAMRRMGAAWKRLHRLVFVLAALALFHYYMQSKADVSAAVLVSGLYVWELLWRAAPKPARARLWLLPLLAVGAALGAAILEALWYGAATRIDPWRVLSANLNLEYPTPAIEVFLIGVAACALAGGRRLIKHRSARPVSATPS